MKNNVDIYKKLVLHFGNQAKTAKALNCKQPSVWAWVHGKAKMSATIALKAQNLTKGKIKATDLCPNLIEIDNLCSLQTKETPCTTNP